METLGLTRFPDANTGPVGFTASRDGGSVSTRGVIGSAGVFTGSAGALMGSAVTFFGSLGNEITGATGSGLVLIGSAIGSGGSGISGGATVIGLADFGAGFKSSTGGRISGGGSTLD